MGNSTVTEESPISDTGRFITEDPIKDGYNWYTYCENNPVNLVDVDGTAPREIRKLSLYIDQFFSTCSLAKDTLKSKGQNFIDIYNGINVSSVDTYLASLFNNDNVWKFDSKQMLFSWQGGAPQKDFGYSDVYDYVSSYVGMNIEQSIFEFTAENRTWRLELWKGNYNVDLGLGGGEIGFYYKTNNSSSYFNAAVNDRLNIAMTLRTKNGICFTVPEQYTWWHTGFQLGNPYLPNELIMDAKIQFKNAEMYNSFMQKYENEQYHNISISKNTSKANTVNIIWR